MDNTLGNSTLTANDIRGLRRKSPDYAETQSLIAEFRDLKEVRRPFFLDRQELEKVFQWKLGNQRGRVAQHLAKNPDEVYRAVTEVVYRIRSVDDSYEIETRFRLLTSLAGVGVPVASAILALTEPDQHCVIDFRGWRGVFGEIKKHFSVRDYVRYRTSIAVLSNELGWTIQETDLAVWEYDRRHA